MGAHFLFTTLGSLGDLHPYIAVGIGLRDRGHTVTIATSEFYRAKVEGEGLRFHPLRPDLGALIDRPEIMREAMHPRTGTEYVFRKLFMPWVEQGFEDTVEAARDADVIVGHPVAFATPTAAEHLQKKWISVALQPSVFLSAFDPSAISGAPYLRLLHSLGPVASRAFFRLARRIARGWGSPLNELRRKLGLRDFPNPVLDDMFSPYGTQGWFSHVLAKPQLDWPARTFITGFPFYDKLEPGQGLRPELAAFLDAGSPPVVFTLGSSAVWDAGAFYTESLAAVRKLGCRAVLLIGSDPRNAPQGPIPDNVFVVEYAPYSQLLPRSAATVHQGGIGTTAQALRAGRPMIFMPYSHDQPDNANRARKLGVARIIPKSNYRADRVAHELRILLSRNAYSAAAKHVAAEIAQENGVRAACEGLEAAAQPQNGIESTQRRKEKA
ncbi:MAG TPA: glycosyltransferase [Bryobacteraceae bacterium]|nr:glycosyltransferase [Bryobacteraceae bacterium]